MAEMQIDMDELADKVADRIRSTKYTPKLTHEQRAARRKEIAQYAADHTVEDACEQFEVVRTTVLSSLREHGLQAKSKGIRVSKNLKLNPYLVLKMLQTNTKAETARKLNCSRERVGQLAKLAEEAGYTIYSSYSSERQDSDE